MRIAVFFGGSSREREVSFAGGRTVIDNLDKQLFQTIPIFVESSANRFILLDWQYLYKGTIRDFYPDPSLSDSQDFQIYAESLLEQPEKIEQSIKRIGREIYPHEFNQLFDFAFLALHGPHGEDGSIQGLLEWYGIPYSGSGMYGSALGISKFRQNTLQEHLQLSSGHFIALQRSALPAYLEPASYVGLKAALGFPLVIKSCNQGSSIGVTVLNDDSHEAFEQAMYKAFFMRKLRLNDWKKASKDHKHALVKSLVDIREGLGMPLVVDHQIIYMPQDLIKTLDNLAEKVEEVIVQSLRTEQHVIIERFIEGKEFSCIVIADQDNSPVALPPTQIIKQNKVFDYRAKYLPGISRKITPIEASIEEIEEIRSSCEDLYFVFDFDVYARIDGFLKIDGSVALNDPNTTSGMMPSSFFFHQAAEIGLNPSRFLTWIIFSSLHSRIRSGNYPLTLSLKADSLEASIKKQESEHNHKMPVAVIMGGYSSERHISVESGRNIYEKLASSGKYKPIPLFLLGNEHEFELYELPIHIMLKDNADDIANKIIHLADRHEIMDEIFGQISFIQKLFTSEPLMTPRKVSLEVLAKEVKFAFIALHGRPGEDGAIQRGLDFYSLPYNGSSADSAAITINKYETNQILASKGVSVASHIWLEKDLYLTNKKSFFEKAEQALGYPMILKPADDGCSSAVKKIHNRTQFEAYAALIFRTSEELIPSPAAVLKLAYQEEFPRKEGILAERLIEKAMQTTF